MKGARKIKGFVRRARAKIERPEAALRGFKRTSNSLQQIPSSTIQRLKSLGIKFEIKTTQSEDKRHLFLEIRRAKLAPEISEERAKKEIGVARKRQKQFSKALARRNEIREMAREAAARGSKKWVAVEAEIEERGPPAFTNFGELAELLERALMEKKQKKGLGTGASPQITPQKNT